MKILVGFDLSYMDKALLTYLSKHHHKLGALEKMYCLYVDKNPDIPVEIKKLLDSPHDYERFQHLIQDELEQQGNAELLGKCKFVMAEGNFEERMMHFADSEEVDLVVLGHKPRTDGTGIRARRLACQSDADILFVPDGERGLKKILVPVDFSKLSAMALKRALKIAMRIEGASIHCMHVYELPSGCLQAKETHPEIEQMLKQHADEKMNEFINQFDFGHIDVQISIIGDQNKGLGTAIRNESIKRDSDIIIMGSRGETFISWILLGSTTEKMMLAIENIPLMIIKK